MTSNKAYLKPPSPFHEILPRFVVAASPRETHVDIGNNNVFPSALGCELVHLVLLSKGCAR